MRLLTTLFKPIRFEYDKDLLYSGARFFQRSKPLFWANHNEDGWFVGVRWRNYFLTNEKEQEVFGMLLEDILIVELWNQETDLIDLKTILDDSFDRAKEYYKQNAIGGSSALPLCEPDNNDIASRIIQKFVKRKAYDGLL